MTEQKPSKADKLRVLQERFINELPSRLNSILQAWQQCQIISVDSDFYRLLHSLAGSAGTFGFPLLGECARELELLVKQLDDTSADNEKTLVIKQKLNDLELIAQQGPNKTAGINKSALSSKTVRDDKPALIYVLEDDLNLAKETEQQLKHFGYRVEVFHTTTSLQEGISQQVPDVLLADIHLPEGEDAGPRAAAELQKDATHEVPVIFISGHNTWQDRLNAVRAGGQSYLSKPINYSLLLDELEVVTGNKQQTSYHILIVDDTKLLAEHYSTVLQAAGMHTKILNNPENILDVLAESSTDLILMDIYMPGCTGVEAAKVIRQHAAYTNLPIVYLSTEKALDQQLEALRVGGDDFLQKPISDNHLVAAVRIRARRFRELTALMSRDSLTGLLNHINLKLTLEREISQARRRSSPLSFVMLDIDNFKSVNDTYGHPIGDRVIKSLSHLLVKRLRKGDIAARYGGEEFAVVLPDTQPEDALDLINDLRRQFAQILNAHESGDFIVTFSAGIASCPPHKQIEALLEAADSALYQAKHAGRNQVVLDKPE